MASYVIRRLPADLIARATAQARDADTTLDAVLIRSLEAYADGVSIAAQLGAAGGTARAARMSARERSDAARAAARHRWRDHDPTPSS